jgi:hypothetical protein
LIKPSEALIKPTCALIKPTAIKPILCDQDDEMVEEERADEKMGSEVMGSEAISAESMGSEVMSRAEIVRVKCELNANERKSRAKREAEHQALLAKLPCGWLEKYGGVRENAIELDEDDGDERGADHEGWFPAFGEPLTDRESENAVSIIASLEKSSQAIRVFMHCGSSGDNAEYQPATIQRVAEECWHIGGHNIDVNHLLDLCDGQAIIATVDWDAKDGSEQHQLWSLSQQEYIVGHSMETPASKHEHSEVPPNPKDSAPCLPVCRIVGGVCMQHQFRDWCGVHTANVIAGAQVFNASDAIRVARTQHASVTALLDSGDDVVPLSSFIDCESGFLSAEVMEPLLAELDIKLETFDLDAIGFSQLQQAPFVLVWSLVPVHEAAQWIVG